MEIFETARSIQAAQRLEYVRVLDAEIEAIALQNFAEHIPRSQLPNILPMFLIGLFSLSLPEWHFVAGLVLAQFGAILAKLLIATRLDLAHSKLAPRYYELALFASGGLWAAMMSPVIASLGRNLTASLMCIVIVATVAITGMAAANQRRFFAAFIIGFATVALPLTMIKAGEAGPIFFSAFLGLFVILTWLTEMMRRQSRELIRTKLENKMLAENLSLSLKSAEYLACRDSLTGLLNRRAFEEAALEIHDSNQGETPITIILIDLDHFKSINDNFGHGVGDEVLKSTADLIVETVGPIGLVSRGDGAVARWGGEEFILLLNNCGVEKSIELAEALRVKLADKRKPHWPQHISVSGSFGISDWAQGIELHVAIGQSDEAMYSAKISGRNRTCVHRMDGCVAVGDNAIAA